MNIPAWLQLIFDKCNEVTHCMKFMEKQIIPISFLAKHHSTNIELREVFYPLFVCFILF